MTGATSNTYTPVAAPADPTPDNLPGLTIGSYLAVRATYTDRMGTAEMASSATTVNTNPVLAKSVSNQAPKFYKNGIVLVDGRRY